ncbi:MAG: hypothetical protein HY591_02575 [Candidatus Omnitrophica bacterium]|nr:hypothetical protein [Candidatus Omnitrophota bacterium]
MWLWILPVLFIINSIPVLANSSREELIARQMDCVDRARETQSVGWEDVCYMGARNEHMQAVNDQLDDIEKPQRAANASYNSFEEIPEFTKQNLDPRHKHTIDVGVEPYYYYYKEPDIPIKNRGPMLGYYAKYTYRPPDDNILNNVVLNTYAVEGRFASSDKINYKGSGVDKGITDINYEFRGLVGKDYLLGDKSLITPYFGFGYRYLLDKGNGRLTSTNNYGYDRHSNYYYIPLGFNAAIPNGLWTSAINLEYDIFIQGLQVSDLSASKIFNPGVDNPNIHNVQTEGFGARASLKLMYAAPRFNFYIEPFIRYWNIDDSHTTRATVDGSAGTFLEPQNFTSEIGSKFGLQF